METWLLITIALISALALVAAIWITVAWMSGRKGAYTDAKLTELIKKTYGETGKDPADLESVKIEEITAEDQNGKSIYDARIKFVSGDQSGSTLDFRYALMMQKPTTEGGEGVLIVESVTKAPSDSPLKKE